MRNVHPLSAGLIIFLGVLSGILWFELRGNRQQIAEIRAELAELRTPGFAAARSVPMLVEAPHAVEAEPVPEASVPVSAPLPASPPAGSVPVITIAAAGPIPVMRSEESVRSEAMGQSDQTATARVLAWRDRLTVAGLTLTTEQLQALDSAMRSELRRETEESLEIARTTVPLDPLAAAQMREQTINRQNETNMRVLDIAGPQLTQEQVLALRTQFEQGHAARLASVRRELEQIANSGN